MWKFNIIAWQTQIIGWYLKDRALPRRDYAVASQIDYYGPYLASSDYSRTKAKWCRLRNHIQGNTVYLFLAVTGNYSETSFA